MIGFITDVVDIAGLINRQQTGVVIDAEEIRTALNQQLLLGGEFRQPRLIESLLSAFLPNLVQDNTPKLNTSRGSTYNKLIYAVLRPSVS